MNFSLIKEKKTLVLVFLIGTFVIISGCSASSDNNAVPNEGNNQSASKNNAQNEVYIVSEKGWASTDVMNLKKVAENSQNTEVMKQLFASRAIFPLKTGLEVQILQEHQGIVLVKPIDSDTTVWTFKSILSKK